jgi:predicted nucleotidyltransferase
MIPTIETRREAVAELCREFNVERLDIFGSAATNRPEEQVDDLDFLVEFGRGGSMSPAEQYFGLLSALQRLFGRDVDLLTRRSLRNPYFIRSVEKTRRLLYAA